MTHLTPFNCHVDSLIRAKPKTYAPGKMAMSLSLKELLCQCRRFLATARTRTLDAPRRHPFLHVKGD